MHYRYSYNENLETPAIFYQPTLFKPKEFGFSTSHVDILPTLLDAMRIPFSPTVFDGESLFNYELRRNPIFFYGYEESISSLDNHLIKVQYSLTQTKKILSIALCIRFNWRLFTNSSVIMIRVFLNIMPVEEKKGDFQGIGHLP
jgi:hypothetical protein